MTGRPAYAMARHGVGRSYQITNVILPFTVRENCLLAAQARRPSPLRFRAGGDFAQEEAAIAYALDAVGLTARANVVAAHLSHGEQRQLEIAMLLASGARLLILDEPMAGMGPEETGRVTALLRALSASHTVILIEHDMDAIFARPRRFADLAGAGLVDQQPDGDRDERAADGEQDGDLPAQARGSAGGGGSGSDRASRAVRPRLRGAAAGGRALLGVAAGAGGEEALLVVDHRHPVAAPVVADGLLGAVVGGGAHQQVRADGLDDHLPADRVEDGDDLAVDDGVDAQRRAAGGDVDGGDQLPLPVPGQVPVDERPDAGPPGPVIGPFDASCTICGSARSTSIASTPSSPSAPTSGAFLRGLGGAASRPTAAPGLSVQVATATRGGAGPTPGDPGALDQPAGCGAAADGECAGAQEGGGGAAGRRRHGGRTEGPGAEVTDGRRRASRAPGDCVTAVRTVEARRRSRDFGPGRPPTVRRTRGRAP